MSKSKQKREAARIRRKEARKVRHIQARDEREWSGLVTEDEAAELIAGGRAEDHR